MYHCSSRIWSLSNMDAGARALYKYAFILRPMCAGTETSRRQVSEYKCANCLTHMDACAGAVQIYIDTPTPACRHGDLSHTWVERRLYNSTSWSTCIVQARSPFALKGRFKFKHRQLVSQNDKRTHTKLVDRKSRDTRKDRRHSGALARSE